MENSFDSNNYTNLKGIHTHDNIQGNFQERESYKNYEGHDNYW